MSYQLLYADRAAGQLAQLPSEFVDVVESHLLQLAAEPTALSIPIASPPFPPRGQLFHFHVVDLQNRQWFFTVIFRYSQDETAIHILSVTWRELIDE